LDAATGWGTTVAFVSQNLLTWWFGGRMLVVSYGIFHKRRRKIMALIPLKARAGIAALTFAVAVAQFVSAIPAKAANACN
jgi:hypothetical protein